MLPNVPQFLVAMAAVLRAGFTVVNVNPLYTARELEHQLKDSGAKAIIILENFATVLQEVIDHTEVQHVVLSGLGDLLGGLKGKWITFAVRHLAKMVPPFKLPLDGPRGARTIVNFPTALAQGRGKPFAPSSANKDSTAFLQYTGGTTGLSKGAVITHRNIVAGLLQAEAWFTPALHKVGDIRDSNNIAALPLYHIFALTLSLLSMRWGAHMTLIPNPRDIPGLCQNAQKAPLPFAARREHLVQRPAAKRRVPRPRFFVARGLASRWHGRHRGHGQRVAEGHGLGHDRRLGHE